MDLLIYTHSEETKKKISEKKKGVSRDATTKQKISETMRGRQQSESHKQAIAARKQHTKLAREAVSGLLMGGQPQPLQDVRAKLELLHMHLGGMSREDVSAELEEIIRAVYTICAHQSAQG